MRNLFQYELSDFNRLKPGYARKIPFGIIIAFRVDENRSIIEKGELIATSLSDFLGI